MKNLKSILAIALALLLTLAVIACDNNKKEEDSTTAEATTAEATTAEATTAEETTAEETTLSPELTAEEALSAYKKALERVDRVVLTAEAEITITTTVSGFNSSSTIKTTNKTVVNGENFSATEEVMGQASQTTLIDGVLYSSAKVGDVDYKQMVKVPKGKEADIKEQFSAELGDKFVNVKAVSGKRLEDGSLELTVTDAGDVSKAFLGMLGKTDDSGTKIDNVEITVKVNADGKLGQYAAKIAVSENQEDMELKGSINLTISADYTADTTVKAPDDAASYEEQKWEDAFGE